MLNLSSFECLEQLMINALKSLHALKHLPRGRSRIPLLGNGAALIDSRRIFSTSSRSCSASRRSLIDFSRLRRLLTVLNSVWLDSRAKDTKPASPEAIPITSAILEEMKGSGAGQGDKWSGNVSSGAVLAAQFRRRSNRLKLTLFRILRKNAY